MLIEALIVLAGIIIILALAEIIIKEAISLSNHFGFSETFVGLTVLSIGTSIPEIMTHIIGSLNILKDPSHFNTLSNLLLGTNIGSDIFQETFVLGVIGIIGTVIVVKRNLFFTVGGMIGAATLTWFIALGGFISRLEGLILLIAYLTYLVLLKRSKINEKFERLNHLTKKEVVWAFTLLSLAFIIMAFVADRVLNASTLLVESLPISASFFGIIVLGIASALPELMTSLIAVVKKKKGMSAGILIGSNITNPLFGIGLGALISTYSVSKVLVIYDLPFKILAGLLLYYLLYKHQDIKKIQGVLLIILFIFYLIFRNFFFAIDL